MTNYVYQLTDSTGRILDGRTEPNIDSVVLSDGPHGMAWQRYSDGLWYPLRSRKGRTWDDVLRCRNLVLVYDAPPRPSPTGRINRQPVPPGMMSR